MYQMVIVLNPFKNSKNNTNCQKELQTRTNETAEAAEKFFNI